MLQRTVNDKSVKEIFKTAAMDTFTVRNNCNVVLLYYFCRNRLKPARNHSDGDGAKKKLI